MRMYDIPGEGIEWYESDGWTYDREKIKEQMKVDLRAYERAVLWGKHLEDERPTSGVTRPGYEWDNPSHSWKKA